jgi:ATP-dependent DNA ligase
MLTDRQPYKDCDIAAARAHACDIAQLKYDGWWSRIDIANGYIRFYSRTQRLFKELVFDDHELSCVLLGEHMQGTQWSQAPGRIGRTYLFDCLKWGEVELTESSYRDRYRVLRLLPQRLPDTFELVPNFRMQDAEQIWEAQVATAHYEGMVFRRGTDPVSTTLYRNKRVFTEDLLCTGFVEGMGKFAGTLGAINAETADHVKVDVGGGLSDEDRREIWDNQSLYLNKWFEVEARAKFDSGSLRHPNFVKWRMDK